MVMGFALCASVAFAQTARISHMDNALTKAPTKATKAAVDYKASIFTKANGHDTIQCFKIDVPSDYTIGIVSASDRINDTLVGSTNAHSIPGDINRWVRYNSIQSFTSGASTTNPTLYSWLGGNMTWITEDIDPSLSPNEPADDGFMFLTYFEAQNSGVFNTYFTVPAVTRPSNAQMIEVSLTQCYRKYYDRCFIDYKVNGQWWAREINVEGIDMGVNNWGSNKVRYVLPHRLNTMSTIEIRVRAWASDSRGNAFGYFWAVDNVAVMALTLTEYWALNSPTKIDGFYGMMPQGMTIPMTWGVNAQNLSTSNINNAKATINAGTDRTSLSQVFQGPATTVTAGNLDTTYNVIINERGFFVTDVDAASGYQSWPNEGTNTSYGQDHLNAGQQGRGLPVATSGKNFYSINVAGGSLSRDYDTILYYVTPNMSFQSGTGREGGYRWGHDNGLIPSGASFQVAFTDNDQYGRHFVTDQGSDPANGGHVSMAGYATHARFITGNDIPVDDNGNPWVFRGIELIAATDRYASDMVGASIVPIAYEDSYEGDGLSFSSLPCGIDGQAFEVSLNDINDQLYTDGGYITPDQGYKAINITFVDQPALQPNTSYRFGYRLNDDAQFALAGTRSSFRFINDTGAVVNVGLGYNGSETQYAQAAAGSRDYRYVQTPATYLEVMAYDPMYGYITAWNIDNYPMIRPIVGPARPVEYAYIGAICDDNTDTNGVMVSRGSDEFCGSQLQVTAGSSQAIVFEPMGDHSVIDRVLLDGVELTPYDENTGEGDYIAYPYNVTGPDPSNPNEEITYLARDYWVYYLSPSQLTANAELEFTVYSHWEEFDVHIGIDPVAPESVLFVSPNPATSMVNVSVKGVEGMVNCSIIDMSGRVVYNADVNAEGGHMINVSNFPAGAYFVRVTNGTFSKIEKLIIK